MRRTVFLCTLIAIAAGTSGVLASTGPSAPASTFAAANDEAFEYVSDFFCFVGGDETGRVAFAFDVNRGRDGDDYEAQTFSMLWVEGSGWRDVGGMQDFEDARDRFFELPSSEVWSVTGLTSEGVVIASEEHGLSLQVDPIRTHTKNRRGLAAFTAGSAAGTLTLGERVVTGRVSHEYCFLSDMNPLAKRYTDLFGDGFDGIYAVIGSPSEGADLRFHESGGRLMPLIRERDGFIGEEGAVVRIEGADFDVTGGSIGGFFRWPARYRANWGAGDGRRSFDLDVDERETVANFVFIGVAAAIVEGTYVEGGVEQPVFGFALVVR